MDGDADPPDAKDPTSEPSRASLEPPGDFSDLEWLVLLPARVVDGDPFPGKRAEASDPAAAARARAASPLTGAVMLRELAEASRILGWSLLLGLRNTGSHTFNAACMVAVQGLLIVLAALVASWNDGMFGSRQVAGGLAAVVLWNTSLGLTWVLIAVALNRALKQNWVVLRFHPDHPAFLDTLPCAQLVRYRQLCLHGGSSPLVAHSDGDGPDCPCPDCTSGLASFTGWSNLLDVAWMCLVFWGSFFLQGYSTFVVFGDRLWSTWWGTLLGCLTVLAIISTFMMIKGRPLVLRDAAMSSLRRRLIQRAVHTALCQLVTHYEDALERGPGAAAGPLPSSFLYARLHEWLAAVWRTRESGAVAKVSVFIQLPIILVVIVLYIASGSCFPAWVLLVPIVGNFSWSMFSLITDALDNAALDQVSALYHDANRRLRLLSSATAAAPRLSEREVNLLFQITQHDRVLSSFVEIERFRTGLFGFPVTLGVVRTIFVTVFTVAVGLWSVLRGLGVFVTLQVFCPTV
ncbi:hypothetical protein DFJ74DRAFT_667623 [Hyaloraphidium curvatum]|nr:hypothetical protein DFJ74DRAFT_667623 [Hyaloraphidium curvatum]